MKRLLFYGICLILFLSFYSIAYGIDNSRDSDNDGLSDNDEIYIYYTNPDYYDTDVDGYDDKWEIESGYSPRHANGRKMINVDSDGDGLNDKWEIAIGTDLLKSDTDGDDYNDGQEVNSGFDPLKNNLAKSKKLIKVDLAKQNLTYSFDGHILESFPISSGVPRLPTPKGNFKILDKVLAKNYGGAGYYYPNTKWNLHFTTINYRYYIHGAYWHNKFGQPMSHGCVNVSYENMEKLYDWTNVETDVEIK
ncbi:MAG: L,D-transpeptidase family protein [Candidatus Buchananbacteria bacterium]|nr:L,D-transpeptidase family protein [Candidatus Buchananbacteria bacterium]